MERKLLFYGTPLNRSLNDDQPERDGPINARRARLNQQQTVRDSQGRQRFHGAFTGGFSAGYFNTVDSTAGFQPRQFVSHRGNKRQDGGEPSFQHKPEDYMDEEDLGEFGIAPKKIRVCNQYSHDVTTSENTNLDDLGLRGLLRPVTLSIGEIILKRMSTDSLSKQSNKVPVCDNIINCQKFSSKNNFHGLGYKPLEVDSTKSKTFNPLTAVLGSGRRLKISGEAFGVGVLDDDEDFLTTEDAYGYDDIGNYEFSKNPKNLTSSKNKPPFHQSKYDEHDLGHFQIPGFIIAKQLNAIEICDNTEAKYPLPLIADDWKMPARAEPYIPQSNLDIIAQQLTLKSHQGTSSFSKKFISGSQPVRSDIIDKKAGLVLYSDLKANDSRAIDSSKQVVVESQAVEATITRKDIEWRPCSLLCKHFNVPNPYPDNLFAGVKPSNLIETQADLFQSSSSSSSVVDEKSRQTKENHREPASLELRRMIFDVTFANHFVIDVDDDDDSQLDIDKTVDSEDEPQVVEVSELSGHEREEDQPPLSESNEDLDVMIVTAPRREPEVIVLSSSSSPSSSSPSTQQPSPMQRQQQQQSSSSRQLMHGNAECHLFNETTDATDTYGPPLPPSLKTLIDLDHHRSRSKHKKKKKKHRKHGKRNSS